MKNIYIYGSVEILCDYYHYYQIMLWVNNFYTNQKRWEVILCINRLPKNAGNYFDLSVPIIFLTIIIKNYDEKLQDPIILLKIPRNTWKHFSENYRQFRDAIPKSLFRCIYRASESHYWILYMSIHIIYCNVDLLCKKPINLCVGSKNESKYRWNSKLDPILVRPEFSIHFQISSLNGVKRVRYEFRFCVKWLNRKLEHRPRHVGSSEHIIKITQIHQTRAESSGKRLAFLVRVPVVPGVRSYRE
jgi:hypothetical protein